MSSIIGTKFFSTVCITDLNKLNLVKFAYGGLVSGSSKFLPLPQLPQKMMIASKVVKNDPKIMILLPQSKSMTNSFSFVLPSPPHCQTKKNASLKKRKNIIELRAFFFLLCAFLQEKKVKFTVCRLLKVVYYISYVG